MKRAASLAAGAAAVVAVVMAGGAHAQESDAPAVDDLDVDIADTIRRLEPEVRRLEPEVRALEPEVRELRTEERSGEDTTVTISADVLFAFDSAELADAATGVVADLSARIEPTAADVLVVGHTDAIGSLEYNQDLSERRAEAVAEAIRAELGDGRTIATEGRNSAEPVAPETVGGEDDPAGRARNRRVAITFAEGS